MGCVSSKILTKSGSFQENWNHSFQKITNVSDEVIISNSKSSGDQFLALLRTTNTASKRIRAASFSDKSETNSDTKQSPPIESAKIETINTWELLAGLEEEHQIEEHQHKGEQVQQRQEPNESVSSLIKDESESGVGRVRSFRTVEDYDALVAAVNLDSKEDKKVDETIIVIKAEESTEIESKIPRRRAMAKELADLKVPSFDFSKSGSLREWLRHGGQVFSPGSYVTPKIGNLKEEPRNGDQSSDHVVFDPEMVAQFDQAMKELTMEEESILKEIVETLEEGNEEDISRMAGKILRPTFCRKCSVPNHTLGEESNGHRGLSCSTTHGQREALQENTKPSKNTSESMCLIVGVKDVVKKIQNHKGLCVIAGDTYHFLCNGTYCTRV